MFVGLGVGVGRQRFGSGIFSAYAARVAADGGVTEAGSCVDAVSTLLQSASLLLAPSGYKSGKVYAEIPTNGNGDLTFTRASTAVRTNSTGVLESMATGVPRLSYMYGSCPALLLEPQRTNLALYSQQFDDAWWTKSAISVTANNAISPDGNTNADKIDEDATTGQHYVSKNGITVLATSTYSISIYAKKSERDVLVLRAFTSAFVLLGQGTFNLTNGTALGTGASIVSVGNGWYRCILTYTTNADTSNNYRFNLVTDGNYTGIVGYGLFIYGAQLEAGAYATTYIPTTTATATRIADSFSRNNIYTNGLITSSGGTWFVELRGNVVLSGDSSGDGIILQTTGNTDNFRFLGNATNGRIQIWKRVSSVNTQIYTTTTDTTKIAFKWNGSTADLFANGTKVVSATAFTATQFQEFVVNTLGTPKFIQQMALYPSPLSDTDCIALTTL